ncbi:N-acetylmuramoyl-L-alanine amidase [Oceanobacillus sp. CAU 1775]
MSQKKNILLVSFLLLSFLFIQPIFAKEALIEGNNLNVRSGPGTEYEPVGQVNSGEVYEIIEEENDWVKIQLEDNAGWVIKEFITVNDDENNEESQEIEQPIPSKMETVIIQHDNTHLRAGASTDSEIITYVDRDHTFDVISETENWLEITDGEITGYVNRQIINGDTKRSKSAGLKNKTIVIDPGHGGRDVGAIGVNGSYEKDISFLTASELERELIALGANVVMTRTNDAFIPLSSRVLLANAVDTDVFISFHYNSFPEAPSATGVESFYYHDQDKPLTTFIHNEIIKETEERDRGVTFGNFQVIRQNFKPSVLLELGFLSNQENEALLNTNAYQRKIVSGIINGLQKYFNMNDY